MELYKKVKSTVGDITILVNNAGIMPTKLWSDHTASDITKIFDVNVFAHFWVRKVEELTWKSVFCGFTFVVSLINI